MIITEGFDEVLDLGRVYANGLHSLRLFRIRNQQPYPVEVRLQSDLDRQIAFQTCNENLNLLLSALRAHTTLSHQQILHWTTNTVDATERSISILGDDSAERQFNLMFNYVNTVGSIELGPHESRDLVLSFLPADMPEKMSTLHRRAPDNRGELTDAEAAAAADGTPGDDPSHTASKTTRRKDPHNSNNNDDDDYGESAATADGHRAKHYYRRRGQPLETQTFDEDEAFFYHDVQGSIYFLVYPLEQHGLPRSTETASVPLDRRISVAPPAFVKSTHVTARVCRSFLWSDISGTVISLPECMPGETHVKDFTVWNRSEIDLYYRLEVAQVGALPRGIADELTFTDADTGDPVGQRPIPGFGHRRLRATFCPSTVGSFTFDIRLENENDAYNCEEARIQAVVKALAANASLVVNEEALDFGVCYSGHGYSRRFIVKNVSELPVEVHLQAQDAHVKFYPVAKDAINDDAATPATSTSTAAAAAASATSSDLRSTGAGLGVRLDADGGDIDLHGLGLSHVSNGSVAGHVTGANTATATSGVGGTAHPGSSLATGQGARSPHLEPIEELVVKPGVERVILATYTPRPDASSSDYQAGRLLRRTFRIQLSISSSMPGFPVPKAYKVIQCRAKTCTSFIGTSTPVLNFGDTDVGTLKSLPLVITNYSELPAQVQIRFASKILTCDRQQIAIPPKQSQEIKFEIYPRKVNPEYRKQVEIVNLNHRQDSQIVEVRSNNVDRKGVSFHSLFYRVITTRGINYLDCGTVICGAPIVRAMMIDNISGEELALGLSSSNAEHIRLYTVAGDEPNTSVPPIIDAAPMSPLMRDTASPDHAEQRETTQPATATAIDGGSTADDEARRMVQHPMDSMAFLDLALPIQLGHRKAHRRRRAAADQGRRIAGIRPQHIDIAPASSSTRRQPRGQGTSTGKGSHADHRASDVSGEAVHQRYNEQADTIWNKVLAAERELSTVPPVFASQLAEETFVQEQIALRSQIQAYIDDGRLVPLADELVVAAHSKRRLMIWYQPVMPPPRTDTTNPRFDVLEHVAIRLARFSRDSIETPGEALPLYDSDFTIPVRQVLLKARLRQIHLEIGQRSINLGPIGKEERRTNVITIRNRGELPLLYMLRKSGSALSGDIVFRNGGQSGVVRGFSVREVEFVYQPSLSGDFSERIVVENILDPQNNGTVHVKAFVRKPTHFYVKPTAIDLGPCLVGGATASMHGAFMITNTDYQTRTFVAKVEKIAYPGWTGEIAFRIERSDGTGALLSEDAQEKIESLEQKMKIARRKGRSDKVKKLEDKLDRLRRGTPDEPQVGEGVDEDEDGDKLHGDEGDDGTPTAATASANGQGGDESELEGSANDAATAAADEAPIRVIKVTAESITFSLVGRITEKLWITLGTRKTHDEDGDSDKGDSDPSTQTVEQQVTGSITVHEQKNADVSQQITFTARVYRVDADYQRALAAWQSIHPPPPTEEALSETETTTTTTATATVAGSANTTEPCSPDTTTPTPTATVGTTTTTTAAAAAATDTPITATPTSFLLAVKLGESIAHTLYLSNTTTETRDVHVRSAFSDQLSVTLSDVEHRSMAVSLAAGEKRSISVSVRARAAGWHRGTVTVTDARQTVVATVPLQCYAHTERLLHFPSLETASPEDTFDEHQPSQQQQQQQQHQHQQNSAGDDRATETLDLGFCYVGGNKYAQIVPLMVASQTDEELQLSCQSNLSQVLVFLDSHATRPATEVVLKPRGLTTLWIAVQPNLSSVAAGSRSEPRDRDGDVRRLIGGLRFTLTTPVPDRVDVLSLGSQILRFTTAIGRSMLRLSQRAIHLGWTPALDEHFYGQFAVSNASARVPAAYQLDCTGGSLSIDRSAGTLGIEGSDRPSEAVVHFRMNSSRYGHLSETISVVNVHNPEQVLEAKVQLLVDDERVALQLADQRASDGATDEAGDNDRLYTLPQLLWDCLPVTVTEAVQADGTKEKQVQWIGDAAGEVATLPDKQIQLENRTDAPIRLTATSELGQPMRWSGPSNESPPQLQSSLFILPARQTATLTIGGVDPARWIDTPSALERGEQVTLTGLVEIRDVEQDRVLKVVRVHAPFAISQGQVKEAEVDVGQVGYVNSWQPVDLRVHLCNLSPLPLHYAIDWPEFIAPYATEQDDDDDDSNSGPIPAYATRLLQCRLHPDRLPDQSTGHLRYELSIRNLHNSANTMSMAIGMEMTTFDLRFERLHNGELILPSLQYPTTMASVPCDSWFKVVNASAQDIRFDIGTERSAQVEAFVRLDVLSRFSNSPLKGGVSLSPNGSIEVRVVASLRPGVRLPNEMRAIIVQQAPIVLGKIWVTTQLTSDALETRLTEDVVVRGTITETCAFSISEKMMQLAVYGEGGGARSSDTAAQFAIHNLAKDLDLSFRLVLENPPGVPLSQLLLVQPPLLEEEDVGSVKPEEQLVLRCWLRPHASRLPDAIRICIIDMHALTEQSAILTLRVPALAKRPLAALSVSPSASSASGSSGRVPPTSSSSPLLLPAPPTPAPPIVTSSTSSYHVATPTHMMAATPSPAVLSATTTTTMPSSPSTTARSSRLGSPLIGMGEEQQQLHGGGDYAIRSAAPPYLTLRGCRRIDEEANLFELDLGQLIVGSPAIVKSMVLSRHPSIPAALHDTTIPYTLCIIPASSASWLSVNRTRGRLGSHGPSHHHHHHTSGAYHEMAGAHHDDDHHQHHQHQYEQSLTITAIPGDISVSTAHIIIESPRDPIHRIMIRVNMEVVAKQNLLRSAPHLPPRLPSTIFSVSTSCLQGGEGLIDMPHVTFHAEYVMRSLMIRNHDAVTLPFTVTADLGADPSDVVFSTSRTSAKLFSTLYIDGGHTSRVYIRFRPMPMTKTLPATQPNTGSNGGGGGDAGPAEQKTIRIYVGCRLVKDYQFAVNLKANCWWPTLSIDKDVMDFRGVSMQEPGGFDISLESGQDILTVTNMARQRTLFTLINDSTFFHVEPASECIGLNGQSSTIIVVRPRLEVLKKHMKTIRREKYICEVVTLYNVERPEERYWITLRITLDQSRHVQAIAVTHITLVYEVMEKRIAEFHSLLGRIRSGQASTQSPSPSEAALPMEQIHFAFRYIVDQLSYYCTIKTGGRFFQLACLFFSLLLQPQIPHPELHEWMEHWVSARG
ncbi:hypothetical protein SYNPS1DRAFT_26661 [Syncephalis pseudoplumigaleata]|uniref:Uncharacterized protein n=1 Tax=Syncephalis pseudoplumigaleata TaxID=1712513 RepID=A0A4P9Z534_9FUNG|nr:hypothetical protein SYNPS1DRAFT_26661 [Syncephalis pseudoplumigaleata]|eukprot:RKP27703.1 hypothetical protein SYNPS1DRAFT_26661 [Syncephalis pseudoplumigaleata]